MVVKRKASKKKPDAVRRGRALPKSRFPAHLRVDTPEEWRALKRMEWRQVTQALERFNCGCHYTPANDALYEIQKLSQQITEVIEADGWIAW